MKQKRITTIENKKLEKSRRKKQLDSIKRLIRQNQIRKALSEIEEFNEKHPDDLYGMLLYGKILCRVGAIDLATDVLLDVVAANGANKYTAMIELANIAILKGKKELAGNLLNEVILKSPNPETSAMLSLSRIERHSNNINKALAILDKAQCVNDKLKENEKKLLLTEKVKEKNKRIGYKIELEKAKCYFASENYEKTRSIINNISYEEENETFKRELCLMRGKIARITSTYEEAARNLAYAKGPKKKLDGITIKALFEEIKLNLNYHNYEQAFVLCKELERGVNKCDDEVYLLKALTYQGLNEYEEAIKNYKIVSKSDIEDLAGTALFYLGNIYIARGEFEEAEKFYFASIEKYKGQMDFVLYHLLILYMKEERYDEAELILERLQYMTDRYDDKQKNNLEVAKRIIDNKKGREVLPTEKYSEIQIDNYNELKAIKHIKVSHQGKSPHKSLFNKDIDVEKLFYDVKDKLNTDDVINSDVFDVYSIPYENVGYEHGKTINNITVITITNTNNIITMYPEDSYFFPRKSDYQEEINEIEAEKKYRIKRTEQFKKKYKLN